MPPPPSSTAASPSPVPVPVPILLVVRFSSALPDEPLEIARPAQTTGAGLKVLLRQRLPEHLQRRRLRLIHAGRPIEDAAPLWTALQLHLRAAAAQSPPRSPELRPSDKGKRPARDVPRLKVIVHCAVGDPSVSSEELQAERDRASAATPAGLSASPAPSEPQAAAAPPPAAPRGFDRLLAAGLTPPEVSALRSQFLALIAFGRTPDTMPTGAELREMEDRWMDEGAATASGIASLSGGGGGGDGSGGGLRAASTADEGASEQVNDIIFGVTMGFFWPLGCGLWLLREEGVWSWRRSLSVIMGIVVNYWFGWVRLS